MVILKTDAQIDEMAKAGKLTRDTLEFITSLVQPGVSTLELNDACHAYILANGGTSACLNYRSFPKSVCISPNNVVCHGIPSASTILKHGDIVNIDITTIVNGWHGDASRMYVVGGCSPEAQKLCDTAWRAMRAGIDAIKPGARVGDIGHAIESLAKAEGYTVVKEFVGHGIGRVFHEELMIPSYGKPGTGVRLEPGMVFTVEPMLNQGKDGIVMLKDGWTVLTKDGKLSAQWEHTIAIRSDWTLQVLT